MELTNSAIVVAAEKGLEGVWVWRKRSWSFFENLLALELVWSYLIVAAAEVETAVAAVVASDELTFLVQPEAASLYRNWAGVTMEIVAVDLEPDVAVALESFRSHLMNNCYYY